MAAHELVIGTWANIKVGMCRCGAPHLTFEGVNMKTRHRHPCISSAHKMGNTVLHLRMVSCAPR
jgi:hypothetical protein